MSTIIKIIWIDDDPRRSRSCENLNRRLEEKADVEFINIRNKEMDEIWKLIKSRETPDLIIIDHNLNNTKVCFPMMGASLAEIIREEWMDIPILCVTAVDLKDIELHKRDLYNGVIKSHNVTDKTDFIFSIATGFKELRNNTPSNFNDIGTMIKCQEDDKNQLSNITPNIQFENNQGSKVQIISKWILNVLLKKPGFLYDRLWTATMLGIKETSFEKVSSIFEPAKYDGVFDETYERWWKAKVTEILYNNYSDGKNWETWKVGQQIPIFDESDYSVCYASRKKYPDTVAYTDITAKKRFPMRFENTVHHPKFESSLYFDDIRMMNPSR